MFKYKPITKHEWLEMGEILLTVLLPQLSALLWLCSDAGQKSEPSESAKIWRKTLHDGKAINHMAHLYCDGSKSIHADHFSDKKKNRTQ